MCLPSLLLICLEGMGKHGRRYALLHDRNTTHLVPPAAGALSMQKPGPDFEMRGDPDLEGFEVLKQAASLATSSPLLSDRSRMCRQLVELAVLEQRHWADPPLPLPRHWSFQQAELSAAELSACRSAYFFAHLSCKFPCLCSPDCSAVQLAQSFSANCAGLAPNQKQRANSHVFHKLRP